MCGSTEVAGAKAYTFDPGSVAPGGAITLTRIGGQECAQLGATDPVSYTLSRQ